METTYHKTDALFTEIPYTIEWGDIENAEMDYDNYLDDIDNYLMKDLQETSIEEEVL